MGDDVINSIYAKIDREKVLMNAAVAMRASSNPQVQQRLDAQIKESQKNLSYLEQRLQDLEMKRGMQNMSIGDPSGGYSGYGGGQQAHDPRGGPPHPPPKGGYEHGYPSHGQGQDYSNNLGAGSGMMPPRAPFGPPPPGSSIPKARPNYSKLDLIKADTPYLGPRFQLMLSQLTFKLTVEKQYKDGIEKLVKLYQDDGDKRSRADAEGRRIESNQKIQLLKQALKRYEDLHIDTESPEAPDDDSINSPQLRKPLTGHLSMRIHAVRDVQHGLTGRFARGPETFCIIKVEDTFKGRTRATRTDKWTDELHEIEVDKANEVEVTVYDKSDKYPTPIGMIWIRITDLVEEMRRKKIESELSGSQWVTAEQMDNGRGKMGGPPSSTGSFSSGATYVNPPSAGSRASGGQMPQQNLGGGGGDPNVIDAWFALEPVGSIKLSMSFVKQNRGKPNFDVGLGRKGAVRQRKEEVMEQYGHHFVLQQFYSIMRCALCGEFLKNAAGMQCEDCKYTCHRGCFPKVVTKCISKSNAESDPDEETLNHRIPHRFEPFSNISANWCCHCGYLLPFGKKNARKCSECGLTVHGTCAHLVPNFCGMSMLRANEVLKQMQAIRPTHNLNKTLRGGQSRPSVSATPSYDQGQHDPGKPLRPSSFVNDQQYDMQQSQANQMPMGNAAAQSALKNYAPQYEQRPQPGRTYSSQDAAAAAAAAAAGGGRPLPQKTSSYGASGPDFGHPGDRMSGGYQPQYDSRQQQQQPPPPAQPQYNPGAYASFDRSGYGQQPGPQQSSYQQPPPPQQQLQQRQPQQQQQQYQQQQEQQKQQQQFQQQQQQQQQQQHQQQQQQKQQQALAGGRPSSNDNAAAHGGQVATKPAAPAAKSAPRVGLEHFNFLAVLGKGNFGKVMLAETKSTKKLYAIKVLKKEFIIENDEVESTKSEKRVFLIANKENHPFLLNLHACFQTETRVYFVMEYISGGDLMLHIQRGQFGLKRAQFYAAEVCLALKYFHENGVIYRDLKLDNIMLSLDGHIKVADYGLCKENMWYGSTTSTFCGTPEFMAPEILLDKKYGRAVDWWAFGVLIYQMLLQQSPFRGEDEDEIYDAILADEPLYPIHMPRDSVSILQKLLTREPEMRLGSGPTDAGEIMSQPFFRNINWDDILNLRVEPPFKPAIKNPTDTSNFDSEFTSVTPVLTPVQSVLTQTMQEEFRGFSYASDIL